MTDESFTSCERQASAAWAKRENTTPHNTPPQVAFGLAGGLNGGLLASVPKSPGRGSLAAAAGRGTEAGAASSRPRKRLIICSVCISAAPQPV